MHTAAILSAFLFGAATLAAASAEASERTQRASLSGEIEAGDRHVTRLRSLPEGASLAVDVTTDGRLRVLVIDEAQVSALPEPPSPVFAGSGEARVHFELAVPEDGTYFLVLDNRAGDQPRRFTLEVRATVDGSASGDGDRQADLGGTEEELARFQDNLRSIFIFDELEFDVSSCGEPDAVRRDTVVTLCMEIGPRILDRLGDPDKARDVLLFMMLQEVSHALLRQWGLPAAEAGGAEAEKAADELAVVLLSMYDQAARLDSVVEFFRSLDGIPQDAVPEWAQRRPGRLDDLERWHDDPEIVRRWQSFLVRHIRTEALKLFAARPKDWVDVEAVEQELARR